MPDKPFFVYYAPGRDPRAAPRAAGVVGPLQGPVRRRAGTRCGRRRWRVRRRSAWCPPDAELTARPDEIPAWDDMPDDLKPVLARQMEVYAGFLEHTDHHLGRLLDALADLGVLEDTLVYAIIGDNGASAEGTPHGCFNELVILNGAFGLETTEFMAARIDEFGTPAAYNHYAVGWAHAMDTPYQWTKQVASHWGGTRNGTIVSWPNGIEARGEVRHQFHHVIDVAPTVLEVAGPARAGVRARRPAAADRGREHGLLVRRPRRRRAPHDAVLRDVRQPRHLPRGLDGLHAPQHAVAPGREPAPRRRRVGALRARRLDPGPRPGGRAARAPARPPAPLPDRGHQVQRAAARRPPRRALQPRPGRATAI